MFYGNDYYVWPRTLPLSSIVKPKPVNKVLIKVIVKNVRNDEIKVKVYRGTGIFKQTLCEVITSLI